jgi:DNA (cytosine-5)-methyltransferase 1
MKKYLNLPSVVDLFCGVGGLTHGLQLAGLRVVAGIDLDSSCQYAYEHNNADVRFVAADISTLPAEEVKMLYPKAGINILVGCAPCQPFSKYTKRYRKGEKTNGCDGDKWQQWGLLHTFANIVKHVLPDVVSMENVPELADEQVFADFCCALVQLGYSLSQNIVNCSEYGVPQKRRRLVLLASRHGEICLIPPLYNEDNYPTVRECIGNLPPLVAGGQAADDIIHSAASLSTINLQRIRHSSPGGTWRDWDDSLRLNCHKKRGGRTYASVYGRMSWDAPSPTITTQFYGYGNGRFGHPEQDRALSLREGALLQSFPPNYEFIEPGSTFNRHEIGAHIGNAVPVLLGKAIGVSIRSHILEVQRNV